MKLLKLQNNRRCEIQSNLLVADRRGPIQAHRRGWTVTNRLRRRRRRLSYLVPWLISGDNSVIPAVR